MTNKTTIGFSGDVSFSAFFKDGYKDENLLAPEIHEFFKGNDANIINQESPITACRITKKKRLSHRSDVEVIDFYQETIPNVVLSLANNHMLDYGRIGVLDSCDNLEKYGCEYIGIGRNRDEASRYIIIGEDVRVGVIAIEYKKFKPHAKKWAAPFCEVNLPVLQEKIDLMKNEDKVDWVVVVYHGGEEFLNCPLPFNKKLLHKIADMGADAIVAHHPHVVQGYEYYKGKPIFYSLGNFIFDTTYQRAQEGTTEGMLVKLTFTKSEITWDNLPIHIDREKVCVTTGEDNPYFVDLKSINYTANWTYQCKRKKEALERATELRVAEKEEMANFRQSEQERIDKIKEKYADEVGIATDEDESDLVDSDSSGESLENESALSKKNVKKLIRKGVRSVFNKKKRTYRRGRFLYATLFRGKEIKA
ncbi:MAG: CapA family protein [Eubacterium sp.]|nr:CapA family protein [Eubacterium sp.]